MTQVPKLACGRVTPLVHILAPSQRPIQITQDLPGFWRDHYPRIKKELQRKYPKLEWRDSPQSGFCRRGQAVGGPSGPDPGRVAGIRPA